MKNSNERLQNSQGDVTRAITVREPYGWLIVSSFIKDGYCVKPIENRSWPTTFRGTVAIHASSTWNDVLDEELLQDICDLHPEIAKRMLSSAHLKGIAPEDRSGFNLIYHVGCILGTVEVFDCLEYNEGDDFRQTCCDAGHGEWYDAHPIPPVDFAFGQYCQLLRNPKQFTQPIPCSGALNFWHLNNPRNPGIAAAVAAAIKKPLGEPWQYRNALHAAGKPAAMPNAGSFAKPRKPVAAAAK